MSKTDKELTTDVVVAYLNFLSSNQNRSYPPKYLPGLIESVHSTFQNLPEKKQKSGDQ